MRREVDIDTLEVKLFDNDNVQFLSQPTWPSGDSWGSLAEAEAWADLYVASMLDTNSPTVPGPSPDSPVIDRPVMPTLPPRPGEEV